MFGKISFPGQKTQKPEPKPIKTKIIQKFKSNNDKKKQPEEKNSLKGSKFRILNELLYTKPSQDSLQYFKQHKKDFQIYHEGFREQASKWSQNPLHAIIGYLKKNYSNKNKLILDLGCGEGELYQKMSPFAKVRAFDLVANKQFVQVADISNLPVGDKTADACVFCLSLMGTNYIDFILQAKRVLKDGGQLLISEVESRSKQWQSFVKMVQSLGFKSTVNKSNQYFRLVYFVSEGQKKKLKINGQFKQIKQFSNQVLGACLYKKR